MLEFQSIKTFFVKGYNPNWNEEAFVIKKIKKTVPWTYVISDLNGQEVVGSFYERNYRRQIKNNLEKKK